MQWFFEYLRGRGKDPAALWEAVGDLIIKTLIATQPSLAHSYKLCTNEGAAADGAGSLRCFEILGFDIFVDRKCRPSLIEASVFFMFVFVFE